MFKTGIGLKPGCHFSPVLFSLFVNDLPEYVGGGINIDEININCLMYADDIVLLSSNPETIQEMINKLREYSEQ